MISLFFSSAHHNLVLQKKPISQDSLYTLPTWSSNKPRLRSYNSQPRKWGWVLAGPREIGLHNAAAHTTTFFSPLDGFCTGVEIRDFCGAWLLLYCPWERRERALAFQEPLLFMKGPLPSALPLSLKGPSEPAPATHTNEWNSASCGWRSPPIEFSSAPSS